MKRKHGEVATNFWPGYVDAMVNVVLNLLFLVAMFGIALAVFNRIPQPENAETASQDATGEKNDPPSPSGFEGQVPNNSPSDQIGSNANGVSETTQLALGSVAASPSRLSETAFKTGANASNGANTGSRYALLEDQPSIVIADAYARPNGAPPKIVFRIDAQGRQIARVELPAGAEPVSLFQRRAVRTQLAPLTRSASDTFLVWSTADASDEASKRASYLAVVSARDALIALGVPAQNIITKVQPSGASAANGGSHVTIVPSKAQMQP